MAIWLPKDRIASEQPVNPDNYAFALHGDDNRLSYRVAYCSANESFGFHSAQEWFEWVKAWGKELQQPTVAWRCKEN